jgi:hypothetical protein
MNELEIFKLKVVRTGIKYFAGIVGIFAVLSYGIAALVMFHGSKVFCGSKVFVIAFLCVPIILTVWVLVAITWFLIRYFKRR